MKNLLPTKARWLMMAIIDILLVSLATPLSFYSAIKFDQGEMLQFWLFITIVIIINAISYALSWLVSWMIFSKGNKDE